MHQLDTATSLSSTPASSPGNPSSHGHHSSTQLPSAFHPRRQLPRVPLTTASIVARQQRPRENKSSSQGERNQRRTHMFTHLHRSLAGKMPSAMSRTTTVSPCRK
ncbi:hypothetical protein DEO72_LG1g2244 [Vigna unguiculata]|uniref:Uncharacterized protein n=1 Tax=Vigna unguiculata TaxID=3917 RepID=A0A4D6KM03_VIGUN|nr:hypothetical protein DEO72_LG1g2244 [Vigna unguiculata]